MAEYVIVTDTACDLKAEFLSKINVKFIELSFRFDGNDKEYLNNDMNTKDFYNKMREGSVAKTAAVNIDGFLNAFEEILKGEKDILYLGFSSGLSTTYNSAVIAANELIEKYPNRKIIVVDTLAASAGQGLLVYLAAKKRDSGYDIDANKEYIENIKLNLCHWFTVDDLVYLKRGGRVSPTVAFVGSVLGIKPILHVDNAGKLISVSKVRGRKASLEVLAQKYGELHLSGEDNEIFISNADCEDEAKELSDIIKKEYGGKVTLVTDVGPVIGAHSGPGTMALFFVGKNR